MKIAKNLLELIGNTPLVALSNYSELKGLKEPIIAKVEAFNPCGSVKDRAALSMIEDAEQKGLLKGGGTIIEPTSGNTGVGLAMVSAIKGYHLILTMPETMSIERRSLLQALGASIELTPGKDGMAGAVNKAGLLQKEIPGSVILQQFENKANPLAHEKFTAEEIWHDTDGEVAVFVAGVGTGGTISGTARTLKKYNSDVYTVAVEPDSSPILSGGVAGSHKIQGIGANFIPGNYDSSVVNEIIRVKDEDAIRTSRLLAVKEGLLVGFSAGASLFAATQLAKRPEFEGRKIVVLLPDTGERYLSTLLYKTEEYPL